MSNFKRIFEYVRANWEAWTAAAVSIALTGMELFSDYLPLIAGAIGGWPLVVIVSVLSFGLATLRAKKRKTAAGEQ